jgi:ribose/xylose/arabinose/galactoside ABC-type transport system permease subunit
MIPVALLRSRYSPSLQQRLLVLVIGNIAALMLIAWNLKAGASFADVLHRAGPNVAPTVLAGLALTGVIFTGAIDLSIASIIVVAGAVFGVMVHHAIPPWAAYLACFGTAWLLSTVNGALIRALRIPAIIVTLAGLPLYRGVALILADIGIPQFSGNISVHAEIYHAPGKIYPGWILGGAVVIALIWELFGKQPRLWLALGNSEEACRLLGLRPGAIQQSAFTLGGLFLGLAALIYVTRVQAIEPARMALGLELQVIGAVVLGGANIFGGEGSYIGTILGAFFLYFVAELLIYAGVSPYFQEVITGALILAVIGFDCALHRRRKMIEELA